MAYVQMLLPSILCILCSWGRLMRMLMQNLISLQHALSAPNPNCVIYRKYIFTCTYFCPLVFMNSLFHKIYRAGCKTCAILACKHWIFLFPGYGDDTDGVSKNDLKINLFKLRPCKTKPTRFTKWWVNQQRPYSDVTSDQCVTMDLLHSSTVVFTLSVSCAYSLSGVILSGMP